jgi:hydroxyacylglutathione hydrolase
MKSVITIKAFSDNYIYLYKYEQNKVIAIDTGDSEPVLRELEKNNLALAAILLTHHHSDHIGGASELKKKTGCKIIGPDAKRINDIDEIVEDKQILTLGNTNIKVIATPGHTTTSVCYYCYSAKSFATKHEIPKNEEQENGILFTGDTLFIGGCGRLFECNAETMWNSLQKLAALPDDTKVYPGHDYTLENYKFASLQEPKNPFILEQIAEIKQGKPTVSSTIAQEKETNIFLKAPTSEIFAELRRLKDNF